MKNGPYELVVAPDGYPGRKYRGRFIYEHHLVWWRNTGKLVPKGYVVHHENEKKRDNRFENLALKTKEEHTALHAPPTPMSSLKCVWCDAEFERETRIVRYKKKIGQTQFFCCQSHQVKQQQKDIKDRKSMLR